MPKKERISISIPIELKDRVEKYHQKTNKKKEYIVEEVNLSQAYSKIIEAGLNTIENGNP